jgi:hypothetical protein
MRVLVCGGRNYYDRGRVYQVLGSLRQQHGNLTIIQGGAQGADEIARDWWQSHWGQGREGQLMNYPAQWDQFGPAAGPIRNQAMLVDAKPDLVVAFPGGRGTLDMVTRARAAGVKVMEISHEPALAG